MIRGENLEYLAADNTWQRGIRPARARHVMEAGSPEMSVRWHHGLWESGSLFFSILPASQTRYCCAKAPSLTGPWSDGEVIYRVPELQPATPGYDRDTFCYAAKEHPEFEDPGSLVFTYVCNTLDVKKLAGRDLDLLSQEPLRCPGQSNDRQEPTAESPLYGIELDFVNQPLRVQKFPRGLPAREGSETHCIRPGSRANCS
jgi:hypothetical protein